MSSAYKNNQHSSKRLNVHQLFSFPFLFSFLTAILAKTLKFVKYDNLFVNVLKELQNPMIPIIYRMQDAAVNSITKYISACFGNKNRNESSSGNSYSGNSGSSDGGYNADSYEPF